MLSVKKYTFVVLGVHLTLLAGDEYLIPFDVKWAQAISTVS